MSTSVPKEAPAAADPPAVDATAATTAEPVPAAADAPAPAAAAAAAAAAPTETAAAEPAADAPATSAPVSAADAAALTKEEDVGKNEVKIEAQPIAYGHLGYKAPGLIKSLRFSPRYFWFDDAALEEKSLSTYLKTEKAEVAHPHAAYASQTGKGLLFFAKREDDKPSPSGILNLSDATDLAKEGSIDFSFKINGQKHTFQAGTNPERDSWIVAVQKAIDEGKPLKEGIVGSEGYKNKLTHYAKPAAAGGAAGGAAAAVKSAVTPKSEDKPQETATTDKPAAVATPAETSKAEPSKTDRSRSQSRKRTSVFGKVWPRKEENEEKKEIKKEEKEVKKEEKEEKKAEKEEKKAEKAEEKKVEKEEKKAEKAEEKQVKKEEEAKKEQQKAEQAAIAAAAAAPAASATTTSETGAKSGEKEASSPTTEPTPTKSKRSSIFGGLVGFGKKDKEKEFGAPKKEEAPAAGVKETQPVAETAPQLAPVETETQKDEAALPAAESTPAATTSPTAAPAAAASPRSEKTESKGGLFGFRGKKDNTPEPKKVEAKEPAEASKTVESPTEAVEATEAPTTTTTTTTTTTATSGSPAGHEVQKERRRSSFFGGLSTKKEKKPTDAKDKKAEVTSESEATDNEKKSSKLQGLFRRASKSPKPAKGPVVDSTAPPAPPAKDIEPEAKAETSEAVPAADATTATEETPAATGEAPKALDGVETAEGDKAAAPAETSAAAEPVAASA